MFVDELDTPVLTLDLDALEANLARYQAYFDDKGIGLRPHIKTHKCLPVAHKQMDAGAIGLTCQKLGEAEVMAAGGLGKDLLIPYNIMGRSKLDRLTALARQAHVTVAADSAYTVDGLAEAAQADKVTLGVIVEVESGGNRAGIPPSEATELAKRIDAATGLELRGLMSFPTPPRCRPILQETLALFDAAGLPHPIVSGGSTHHALEAHEIPELTEYRAGEYAVGGAGYLLEGSHTVEQCALRLVTTVVSRPTEGRAILDGGSKSLSAEARVTDGVRNMGHVVEYSDARLTGCSEEHGQLDVSDCERKPEIGERVQVLPIHPCPCVNEHDVMVAVRGGRVEAVWPVHARGKIR